MRRSADYLTGVGTSNNYAYLVVDDKSKDAVIIDPANPPEYAIFKRQWYHVADDAEEWHRS
jgi:hypothetical protein